MKTRTIYLQLTLCLIINVACAQVPVFWAASSNAGPNLIGTIYKIDADGTNDTVLHSFNFATGGQAHGGIIKGADGKFYGTAFAHGAKGGGVIFSFDPVTRIYTDEYDFDVMSIGGAQPYAKIMQATNGLLYGTNTQSNGNDGGVLYSFDATTHVFTRIHTCTALENFVYQGPMQASNGKIYGTLVPSTGCYGAVYCVNPANNSFNVYQMPTDSNCIKGKDTESDLMEGEPGILYGTTHLGGDKNLGVIFSFNTQTNTFTRLFSFDSANGGRPGKYALLAGGDGKVYGTTPTGGAYNSGVIFSLDTITHAYTKLFDFHDTLGIYPESELLLASDGKIYGSTSIGGTPGDDNGVIYSFDRATNQVKVIKNIGVNCPFGLATKSFIEYGTKKTATGVPSVAYNNFTFQLSPNPAASIVNIYWHGVVTERRIIVTDITGKQLVNEIMITDKHQISTDAFANGIYFVTIGGLTRKLLVNK